MREGDYSREAIISNISHRSSRPKYIALLYQARKEKSEIHEHYYRKKLKKSCDFVTIQSILSIIQKLWSYSSGGELGTMMIMTMMMMNPKVVKIHLFLIFLPVLIFFFLWFEKWSHVSVFAMEENRFYFIVTKIFRIQHSDNLCSRKFDICCKMLLFESETQQAVYSMLSVSESGPRKEKITDG